MNQEDKKILLQDLSARLPYGVKIMVEGWDSDMGCEFTTVETLRGINDRFIYTIWDKTGDKEKHSIVEPLSILDYKPFLRSMSSMTEEEMEEYNNIDNRAYSCPKDYAHIQAKDRIDWLNAHHFDYRGLIEKGLAFEAPKGMYYEY